MIFWFVFLGFCFGRWGFAAEGLISGLGWSWDGLVLGWAFRLLCAIYSGSVFASSRPGLGVFGLIGFRYQGWADGNARDSGQGTR